MNGELCHLILYSGYAGQAYCGLGIVDPKTGDYTSPYTTTRYGLPPESSNLGEENSCHHTNIKGEVYAGGITFQVSGHEFYQSVWDGETASGSAVPGLVCWKSYTPNVAKRSTPTYKAWADGKPAYFTWFPEYPCFQQIGVTHTIKNWRGQVAMKSTMNWSVGGYSSFGGYSFLIEWDPNFSSRGKEFGAGRLKWDATNRLYVPYAHTGAGTGCVIYALPVASDSVAYTSPWTAESAFDALFPFYEEMPTVPFIGAGAVRLATEGFNALNMNNIENAGSLSPKDILPIRALRDFRKNPVKGISSLYLWYKYSFVPNVSDMSQLWRNIGRLFNDVGRKQTLYGTTYGNSTYQGRPITTRYNARVIGNLNCRTEMQKVSQRFSSIGLGLNSKNVWDLIPFSFILDWFLPISELLEETDYENSLMLNKWNISSVEQSTRTQWECPADVLLRGATGTITIVRYDRTYDIKLPTNQLNFGSKKPIKHIFDGAALVISNW